MSIKTWATTSDFNEGTLSNTTGASDKLELEVVSAWTVSNGLNSARGYVGGAGTQSAALSFLGYHTVNSNDTEEYDGSTWSTQNNANVARYAPAGFGTQAAAVSCGGNVSGAVDNTEEYGGVSWVNGNALNQSRHLFGGAGTLSAGLSFGGTGATQRETEEYDGTTWTTSNDTNNSHSTCDGCGIQTSALVCGGAGKSEEYNGTSWTSGNDLNVARTFQGAAGTQDSALSFGGQTASPYSDITEKYDGTTWSLTTSLNTARRFIGGTGVQSAALSFGGYAGNFPAESATEEFNIGLSVSGTWTVNFGSDNTFHDWNTVSYVGSEPGSSEVKFRLKTSDTQSGLDGASWGSYYTSFPADISSISDSKWLSVQFLLISGSTPVVNDVILNYDTDYSFSLGGNFTLN